MRKTKTWLAGIAAGIVIMGLTGCQNTKLSEEFEEEMVKAKAEDMIALVNAEDYETLMEDEFSEMMKLMMDGKDFEEPVKKIVSGKGGFQKIKKSAVTGGEDPDTEEPFAVAVVLAEYEEGNIQYTISFDKDMKICGFYLK